MYIHSLDETVTIFISSTLYINNTWIFHFKKKKKDNNENEETKDNNQKRRTSSNGSRKYIEKGINVFTRAQHNILLALSPIKVTADTSVSVVLQICALLSRTTEFNV